MINSIEVMFLVFFVIGKLSQVPLTIMQITVGSINKCSLNLRRSMKYIYVVIILLLSGCSSQSSTGRFHDDILKSVSGNEVSRNPSKCPNIKSQCLGGNYEEWLQQNGQKACACNK